jgi:tRNA-specific 2-thiouridylase
MSRNGKVIVAMSGGVDSSVAASLLREQGYECVGVFLRVGAAAEAAPRPTALPMAPSRRLKHGCCSVEDALDARVVAGKLGMPFYVLNFEADFGRIVDYFVDEYARARTPNPCIHCNTDLKFGKLLRYADMLDAEFVATGHYARVLRDGGVARLARGRNPAKDQSYVLFGMARAALARCLFPVGEIDDKAVVRQIAAELGLKVHDKPDSQEICFVPDNDYKRLVRSRRPETQRPGEVRDAAGNVVGRHDGVANYTIGQRRGLGIAAGHPIYVTHLDAATNTVVVGDKADVLQSGLVARAANWLVDVPERGAAHPATIKIRHQHTPAAGRFEVIDEGGFRATFDTPQPAVTPGQAAVLYDDDGVVLGGGWIEAATG